MISIPKLIEVKATAPYKLWLQYADGQKGEIDLNQWAGQGIFKRWDDAAYFKNVFIPSDHQAVAWDDELELCTNTLYLQMVGEKYEEYAANK